VSTSILTAAQTETLIACYRARLWGANPDWPTAIHPSRPCVVRDTVGLRGKATHLRALERKGFVVIEETGHGMGACGVSLVVTLTAAGVDAARAALGPECEARVAQWAAKVAA
jgi:hypothetical protein